MASLPYREDTVHGQMDGWPLLVHYCLCIEFLYYYANCDHKDLVHYHLDGLNMNSHALKHHQPPTQPNFFSESW